MILIQLIKTLILIFLIIGSWYLPIELLINICLIIFIPEEIYKLYLCLKNS